MSASIGKKRARKKAKRKAARAEHVAQGDFCWSQRDWKKRLREIRRREKTKKPPRLFQPRLP